MVTALLSVVVAMLPACDSDDGSSDYVACSWDAQVQGDGTGSSFIVTTEAFIVLP